MISKLSDQQITLAFNGGQQLSVPTEDNPNLHDASSSESTLLTPASDGQTAPHNSTERVNNARTEAIELARLERELHKAQDQIARQAQEISTNRVVHQNMVSAPLSDFQPQPGSVANPRPYNNYNRQFANMNDDVKSDLSDVTNPSTEWSLPARSNLNYGPMPDPWGFPNTRNYNQRPGAMMMHDEPAQQRNYSVPLSPIGSGMGRGMHAPNAPNFNRGFGYPGYGGRGNYVMYTNTGAANFNNVVPGSTMPGVGSNQGYQPQPIGTPLSAAANAFNPGQAPQQANPWNAGVSTR